MTLRVLAFTKTSPIGPSSRYRYYQYVPWLRQHGVELTCRPLFGPTWFRILRRREPLRTLLKCVYAPLRFLVRLGQLWDRSRFDLLVVEHQLFPYLPAWFERALRALGARFTVEFDDAIYLTRLHGRKMEKLCALADHVVVGNEHLARFARRFNAHVSVVPTTIPLERYPSEPPVRREKPEPFVVGWIGLPYNFGSLRLVQEPLKRIARDVPLLLRVVSDGRPEIDGVPLEVVPWSEPREIDQILGFDAGIMPLHDDEWSRGKCGLKVLQYFAAFVPVVASPVGVNRTLIRDGETGFLASDDGEFERALRLLIKDPELRRRVAAAGRREVERNYAASGWAGALALIWREAAGSGGER